MLRKALSGGQGRVLDVSCLCMVAVVADSFVGELVGNVDKFKCAVECSFVRDTYQDLTGVMCTQLLGTSGYRHEQRGGNRLEIDREKTSRPSGGPGTVLASIG